MRCVKMFLLIMRQLASLIRMVNSPGRLMRVTVLVISRRVLVRRSWYALVSPFTIRVVRRFPRVRQKVVKVRFLLLNRLPRNRVTFRKSRHAFLLLFVLFVRLRRRLTRIPLVICHLKRRPRRQNPLHLRKRLYRK